MTRGLPFGPKSVFASGEKSHHTRFLGFGQSLLIHVALHQNFTSQGILNDGRDETVHFREIDFHCFYFETFEVLQTSKVIS
jgi:hypothetical protein